MKTRFAVVGRGTVGKAIVEQAQALEWNFAGDVGRPMMRMGQTDWVETRLNLLDPDIVFVSTPPFGDKGRRELEILQGIARYHLPTIICTKEVLAHKFRELQTHVLPYVSLACNASAGGASGILQILQSLLLQKRHDVSLELSLNASTNFWLWRTHTHPQGMQGAHGEAVAKCLLEPGTGSMLEKFNRELLDKCIKTCALFNVLNLGQGEYINPGMFGSYKLNESELGVVERTQNVRLVVSMWKGTKPNLPKPYLPWPELSCGGWHIAGGFQVEHVDWIPEGPSAAARVVLPEYEVPLIISGQGAGAQATASRMILDARHLLERQESTSWGSLTPASGSQGLGHVYFQEGDNDSAKELAVLIGDKKP